MVWAKPLVVQKSDGDEAGRVDREERRATNLSQVSPSPCWVADKKRKRREERKERTQTVSHRVISERKEDA